MKDLDRTDIELCRLLSECPKAGMREYARALGVARATVSSRIEKLVERGVIGSFAPHFDPAALGFPLGAFVHVTLDQRTLTPRDAGILEDPLDHRGTLDRWPLRSVVPSGSARPRTPGTDHAAAAGSRRGAAHQDGNHPAFPHPAAARSAAGCPSGPGRPLARP